MEVVCILIAKTKEGQYFTLTTQIGRQTLRQIRINHDFYCPQCGAEVLLKIGEFNIPHFSHRKESSCRSLFTEGESSLHLAGKQQLYDFFNQQSNLIVQLEPYITDLRQRPDLLVSTKHKKIPIEFQCSRIPTTLIKRRTAGYGTAEMTPIWILQTPKKIKQLPQGITIQSISRFEESFLQMNDAKQIYLLTYDAEAQKFHYLSSLLHVSGRKYIVNHRTLSITQQSFPFAIPNDLTLQELEQAYSAYSSLRINFLKQRILYNRKGIQDPFLRTCYELKMIPSELPEWIGMPIMMHRLTNEHACEWQLKFLHFMYNRNINTSEMTEEAIHEFITLNSYSDGAMFRACEKYLRVLLAIGVTSVDTQLSFQRTTEVREVGLQSLQSEVKIEKI